MTPRTLRQPPFAATLAIAHLACAEPGHDPATHQADMPNAAREAEVAQRGQHVMPFSLEQTLHIFTKTAKGGVQKVAARDAADIPQTRLIREHLKSIRTQFLKGDFSGPSHIHGDDMPGLAALKAARPGAITITYREVQGGGTLTYTTRAPP